MLGSEEVLPPSGAGGQLLSRGDGGDGGDGGVGGGEDRPEDTGAQPRCCQHCYHPGAAGVMVETGERD